MVAILLTVAVLFSYTRISAQAAIHGVASTQLLDSAYAWTFSLTNSGAESNFPGSAVISKQYAGTQQMYYLELSNADCANIHGQYYIRCQELMTKVTSLHLQM